MHPPPPCRASRPRHRSWGPVSLVLALGAIVVLGVAGCSVIGLMAGIGIDSASNGKTPARFLSLKLGESITLRLHGGGSVSGKYRGMVRADSASYARQLAIWDRRPAEALSLPALRDSVRIGHDRDWTAGRFGGLTERGIRILPLDRDDSRVVPYGDAGKLWDTRGHVTTGEMLQRYVNDGRVPMVEVARIEPYAGPERDVAWIEIERLEAPTPSTAKILLASLGFVLDIGTIVFLTTFDPLGD